MSSELLETNCAQLVGVQHVGDCSVGIKTRNLQSFGHLSKALQRSFVTHLKKTRFETNFLANKILVNLISA